MNVKAREVKKKEREGKILFTPRTRVTYIELYGLGPVKWVSKMLTHDIHLLGFFTHYHV